MTKPTKLIILIGGAPTTGKSTTAELLAKHLDLPWISTDQIREIMRGVVSKKDFPKLFIPEETTADIFLNKYSTEEIVKSEFEECEEDWIGMKTFIEDEYNWTRGFIMEGTHILPHLVAKGFTGSADIRTVFLVDENEDRIRDVVFKRGLWDEAHKYSEDVKEKEVKWVCLFSKEIKEEARKYNFPVIEVEKRNESLEAILKVLKL